MGIWTYDQINYTQRSILKNIGYGIKQLWDEEIISEAMRDMQRAGQQFEPHIYDQDEMMHEREVLMDFESKSMSIGKVPCVEEPLTPGATPMAEEYEACKNLGLETKKAFSEAAEKEPFPLYVDPGIEDTVLGV